MIRIVFSVFVIVHGLLHLIGFAKEWNITAHQLPKKLLALTDTPSTIAGVLWFTACLLFVAAGLVFLLRKEWFWAPAAAGLVISQVLIILNWDDARYGTIMNLLILIAVVISAAAMQFKSQSRQEVEVIMSNSSSTAKTVTEEMLVSLPAVVQRWIRQSGIVGRPMSTRMRITQRGTLRTTPKGAWMPFEAVQYFSFNPPAFVWTAEIRAAGVIPIAGRDKFIDGHGNMHIRPLYIFDAANSSGPEIDEGTLIRYLAEIPWFPQAALSDYLSWEGIDDSSARVTMNFGGMTASGTCFFDESGQMAGFEALRYGEFEGAYRKERWSVNVKHHRTFDGVTIGANSEVTWKLKEGDFTWLKVRITDVEPVN